MQDAMPTVQHKLRRDIQQWKSKKMAKKQHTMIDASKRTIIAIASPIAHARMGVRIALRHGCAWLGSPRPLGLRPSKTSCEATNGKNDDDSPFDMLLNSNKRSRTRVGQFESNARVNAPNTRIERPAKAIISGRFGKRQSARCVRSRIFEMLMLAESVSEREPRRVRKENDMSGHSCSTARMHVPAHGDEVSFDWCDQASCASCKRDFTNKATNSTSSYAWPILQTLCDMGVLQ
jgi:hypothetical protein